MIKGSCKDPKGPVRGEGSREKRKGARETHNKEGRKEPKVRSGLKDIFAKKRGGERGTSGQPFARGSRCITFKVRRDIEERSDWEGLKRKTYRGES